MLRLRGPADPELRAVLETQSRAAPTYREVGATRALDLPAGYTHDRYDIALGEDTFEVAKRGLLEWQAHVGAGVSVIPASAPIEPDTTVLLGIRAGPLYALAACRIIYVCDEADRFGFAYGTLPAHPEVGEEAFVVERDANGDARFVITAFSRPGSLITRLARPVTRIVQQRVTRGYLEALRSYVTSAS